MYFVSGGPCVGVATVPLGANTCVTLNGVTWMWNGWEMFGFAVAFVIVHSSTVLRDTCWALSSPLNFLPLIVCCASGAVEAKLIVREPFTSESAISSRNLGGVGAGEMNCDCWPVTGCWPALMRTHISVTG